MWSRSTIVLYYAGMVALMVPLLPILADQQRPCADALQTQAICLTNKGCNDACSQGLLDEYQADADVFAQLQDRSNCDSVQRTVNVYLDCCIDCRAETVSAYQCQVDQFSEDENCNLQSGAAAASRWIVMVLTIVVAATTALMAA